MGEVARLSVRQKQKNHDFDEEVSQEDLEVLKGNVLEAVAVSAGKMRKSRARSSIGGEVEPTGADEPGSIEQAAKACDPDALEEIAQSNGWSVETTEKVKGKIEKDVKEKLDAELQKVLASVPLKFPPQSCIITEACRADLDKVAAVLRKAQQCNPPVIVHGHSDAPADDQELEYLFALTYQRAQAVVNFMKNEGLKNEFTVVSWGNKHGTMQAKVRMVAYSDSKEDVEAYGKIKEDLPVHSWTSHKTVVTK